MYEIAVFILAVFFGVLAYREQSGVL